MQTPGIVMLNDDEIGTFTVETTDDNEEKITIQFYKGAAGIEESLEYAAEQGMIFSLALKPEYGSKD